MKEDVTFQPRKTDRIPETNTVEQLQNRPKSDFRANLAVAASLVLCAVTLRSGALPGAEQATDALLSAVSSDTLLDEHLGRLSFVSAMFPEAALVFGEIKPDIAPVEAGEAVHTWSEAEPYTVWHASEKQPVYSVTGGEVSEVTKSIQGELTVVVRASDGTTCIYGNLSSTVLREGDEVNAGDIIGQLEKGQDIIFELREEGRSVQPGSWRTRSE